MEKTDEEKKENPIRLCSLDQIDEVVLAKNDEPAILEEIKSANGDVLIAKYTPLKAELWRKYRAMDTPKTLLFICEEDLKIIENIIVNWLNFNELQALGAWNEMQSKDKIAQQFFTEALESDSAVAFINMAIYWYRLGDRTPMDNYNLSQRMMTRGRARLVGMNIMPAERMAIEEVCNRLATELDFELSPPFLKFFRMLFRFLTFSMTAEIKYIGPADPQYTTADSISEILSKVEQKEMELKRGSADRFIEQIRLEAPEGAGAVIETLDQVQRGLLIAADLEQLEKQKTNLEYILRDLNDARQTAQSEKARAKRDAMKRILDGLKPEEQVELRSIASKFSTKTIAELIDAARVLDCRKNEFDRIVMYWLIREHLDNASIMERLLANPTIPPELALTIDEARKTLDGA